MSVVEFRGEDRGTGFDDAHHVRDCGIRAIAAATATPRDDVERQLLDAYGTSCINGKQMRDYLTSRGWTWHNARGRDYTDIYADCAVVVTRRGFFAITRGRARGWFPAALCGYYTLDEQNADRM